MRRKNIYQLVEHYVRQMSIVQKDSKKRLQELLGDKKKTSQTSKVVKVRTAKHTDIIRTRRHIYVEISRFMITETCKKIQTVQYLQG